MTAENSYDTQSDQSVLMQGLYWWGVPTLFRCPQDPDPRNCDIALVGVPHSTGNGTTERDQHLGPRAVRHVSAIGRRVHGEFQLDPWKSCRINDLGDVPLPEGNDNEKSIADIKAYYERLARAGSRPVSIGGDHSITGAIVQALVSEHSMLTKGEKIALLHFDAHTDTFHNLDHFLGARRSAAHWASYIVQEGQVEASASTQVGIRGNVRTLDWLATSRELGYEIISMQEVRKLGIAKVIETFLSRIGERPVYITFDLDCLDPTIAPAVSNLEAGCNGFTIDQAVELLRGVRGKNVIGGDVVCIMPTKDQPNQITSMVATSIMFELISLIADRITRLPDRSSTNSVQGGMTHEAQ